MRGAFYVTGTDTGIGKTRVSAALLGALRDAGIAAGGMKPLASGCELVAGTWRNEDAEALLAASVPGLAYADVNPIALPLATAPEIAAAKAGITVDLGPVEAAHARLRSQVELLVVEGVGGWLAPLAPTLMQSDLVNRLQLPALLVVGLRLGCINHALLTLRALRADGVAVLRARHDRAVVDVQVDLFALLVEGEAADDTTAFDAQAAVLKGLDDGQHGAAADLVLAAVVAVGHRIAHGRPAAPVVGGAQRRLDHNVLDVLLAGTAGACRA